MVMLVFVFSIDLLIRMTPVSFPASVAGMIILFLLLLFLNRYLEPYRMRSAKSLIDIPAGFCLRWINVLFTTSFVTLPLSKSIDALEILKLGAVFGVLTIEDAG